MKKLITMGAAVAAITGLAGTTAETGKSTPKGFTDDFDAAMTAAAKSEKNLWVLFTGSDWCYWCKKLEKEVISKPEFAAEGAKKFELVFLDFPNDKSRIRKELAKRNRELAKKYGVRGYPSIVLVDAKGEKLIAADRPSGGENFAEYFDRQLKKIALVPDIKKFIHPYETEFTLLGGEWQKKVDESFKNVDGKDDKSVNAAMAELKKVAPDFRARAKEIRKRFRAEQIPEALSAQKEELLEEMFMFIKEIRLIIEGKRDRK